MKRRLHPWHSGEVRARTARLAAAALTVAVGAGVMPLAFDSSVQAQPRATGSPLLDETFTQATAAEFTGVGSACLTGAPAAAAPGPGTTRWAAARRASGPCRLRTARPTDTSG